MSVIANSTKRLLLFGPPCCGKGTLAQQLATRLKIPHISTGAIFRSHLAEHTAFGEEIKHFMQEGRLVPDTLVTQLTLNALNPLKEGFILDGYPRTLNQAHALHNAYGWPSVIHLDASDETIIGRLAGRISCVSCGTVFNHLFHPPKEGGICDHCRGELVQRIDDTRETAMERLKTYHCDSEPLVDLYKEKGVLTTINTGELTPEDIYKKVIRKMFSEDIS
jgi:adenylate kinase